MFSLFKKKKGEGAGQVITRIAPSPTGVLHVGTARTALFNYLYAKQNKGKFILRIEDTDTERSTKEFEENIVNSLEWLGLKHDEFYRQSERSDVYEKYLDKLIKDNKAYVSKEASGERDSVIRFRNPNKEVIFTDEVRGEIKFDTTELGDFVIAKSMTEPLYHLAVVVDDHEMGITHIIRGEDGISNTPRQILIQEAIGAKTPSYGHLPLILGKDKSKLSKRHGAVSLSEYKKSGYMKEAIINHLAMLGWNPGTEKEIFTMDELLEEFSLEKVSKGGAVFNIEKLDWFNKEHLRQIPAEELEGLVGERLSKFNPDKELLKRLTPVLLEKISNVEEIDKMVEGREVDYYFTTPDYDPQKLIWKEVGANKSAEHLEKVSELLSKLNEYEETDTIKQTIWGYADEEGRGDVLWPLRYSLSGVDKSPDPFVLVSILGKTESLERIGSAVSKLNELAE